MKNLIELSHTEVMLAFTASCIESTARKLGKSYQEIFARMNHVGIIENYILPHYETLHTESREHVTNNIIDCLITWEEKL